MLTGRGTGCGRCGCCCGLVSASPFLPLFPLCELDGDNAVMPGFSRREMLPLRPRAAKKPPFGALAGTGDTRERMDVGVMLLAVDEERGNRCGCCGMASDG